MKNILGVSLALIALGFSSCDKIEDTGRTVVVSTLHPPDITYHLDLGLNQAQSEVSWDTTGEISHTIQAQAGDVIYYLMGTGAMGSQLNIMVDGSVKLSLDFSGDAQHAASGYLVVD